MPIEAESPEQFGYERIRFNLAESSVSDVPLREFDVCAIKDAFSNRIAGYSIDERMKASLAAAALTNAIGLRRPRGTVVHSDRGSQTGLNRWSQHRLVRPIVGVRSVLQLGSSSRGSCAAGR